jgi:predicted TIM-barrel fold metal-dependent hydrolase
MSGPGRTTFSTSWRRTRASASRSRTPAGSTERRSIGSGNYRRPEQIIRRLAEAYPDKFLFGSDAPYYSYVAWYTPPKGRPRFYDLRSSMEKEVGLLNSLPAALRRRVCHANTLRFLTGK